MTRNELIIRIQEEIPQEFILRMLKSIPYLWEESFNSCRSEHTDKTAKELFPYKRRALIEDFMYEVGKTNPAFKTTQIENSVGNSTFYALETESFIIIQSVANGWSNIPRKALFREDLSQGNLFEEFLYSSKLEKKICLILTHGAEKPYSIRPDFIKFYIENTGSISLTDLIIPQPEIIINEKTELTLPKLKVI
ncbi:MAG: hypothetical protein IPH62_11560 [Ignavibacteriae bacterium]|nr:hypothetical protein [Ignavibacteriota bacterium]